jgi:hypothetical protein
MKVVGHQHKLMEQIFCLITIFEQHLHKEIGHSLRLEKAFLLKSGCSDEVCAIPGVASGWGCHRVPRRLKPFLLPRYRSAEALRHPKADFDVGASRFGAQSFASSGRAGTLVHQLNSRLLAGSLGPLAHEALSVLSGLVVVPACLPALMTLCEFRWFRVRC